MITYQPPRGAGPEGRITHRIFAITHDRQGRRVYRTKGDANPAPDPWQFTLSRPKQARVTFHVPFIGYAFAALGIRQVRMLVIGLPALLVAFSLLAGLWRETAAEARSARAPARADDVKRSARRHARPAASPAIALMQGVSPVRRRLRRPRRATPGNTFADRRRLQHRQRHGRRPRQRRCAAASPLAGHGRLATRGIATGDATRPRRPAPDLDRRLRELDRALHLHLHDHLGVRRPQATSAPSPWTPRATRAAPWWRNAPGRQHGSRPVSMTNPGANLRGTISLGATASDGGSGLASIKLQRKTYRRLDLDRRLHRRAPRLVLARHDDRSPTGSGTSRRPRPPTPPATRTTRRRRQHASSTTPPRPSR